MKKLFFIFFIIFIPKFVYADVGVVVKRFGSCDYYIVDGTKGLYVLEWYGGHDPYEGEKIVGNIGSYGMKDVVFPTTNNRGRVWVEDFLESASSALEIIRDHCR